MRLEYTLIPKKDVPVKDLTSGEQCITIDNSEVCITVDKNIVREVRFTFEKVDYRLMPFIKNEKRINFDQEQIKQKLYKLCSYISNRIYTESNIDAIDCSETKNLTPKLVAETKQEEKDIKKHSVFNMTTFTIVQSIVGDVSLQQYATGYEYEKAFTAFADGQRVNNPITRYVQYWKSIEALFPNGKVKDKILSEIVTRYGFNKTEEEITYLREVRNRCEHPNTYHPNGHLSTSDIRLTAEIEKNIQDIWRIAKIMINHCLEKKDNCI